MKRYVHNHIFRILSVLKEVQRKTEHSYLNEQALLYIAESMEVPLSLIYSFFNLKAQGEHTITVCRRPACHTRGSKPLLDDVMLASRFKRVGILFASLPDEQGVSTGASVIFGSTGGEMSHHLLHTSYTKRDQYAVFEPKG
ncbi:MAG TPA: NAD(P)H-dependent oxidoreductase subunit E [Sphaerochaeta sp.]|nr:NAD(P)H-dependent oxidoreductase subunit E [Sphaerochaeta sp.]